MGLRVGRFVVPDKVFKELRDISEKGIKRRKNVFEFFVGEIAKRFPHLKDPSQRKFLFKLADLLWKTLPTTTDPHIKDILKKRVVSEKTIKKTFQHALGHLNREEQKRLLKIMAEEI